MLERIRTIEADMRYHWGEKKATKRLMYQWRGTWSQFLADIRTLQESPQWRSQGCKIERGTWGGFTDPGSTAARLLETGKSPETLRAFDEAMARMEAAGARDRLQYVPASGTWSVGRVLTGHPLAAMKRPRTALPVINADLGACFSAYVRAEDAARTMAVLARSIWNHIQAGGAATLRINYVLGFSTKARTGEQGIIISIDVPLTNPASVAAALSVQTFRAFALAMGVFYSGEQNDGLRNWQWHKPGLISMQGDSEHDLKALRDGKIITPEDGMPKIGKPPGA